MTSNIGEDVIRAAVEEARAQYIAAHPEMTTLDFRCPSCGAKIGRQCRSKKQKYAASGPHTARLHRYMQAQSLRDSDITNCEINRRNELLGVRLRLPTMQHVQYVENLRAINHSTQRGKRL